MIDRPFHANSPPAALSSGNVQIATMNAATYSLQGYFSQAYITEALKAMEEHDSRYGNWGKISGKNTDSNG